MLLWPQQLTYDQGVQGQPSVSPDGNLLAYLNVLSPTEYDHEGLVMNIREPQASAKVVKKIQGAAGMSWSSDGKWLSYTYHDGLAEQVFKIEINAEKPVQLTDFEPGPPLSNTSWSSTGLIVFVRNRVVLSVDPSTRKVAVILTPLWESEPLAPDHISVSPDGRKLAFSAPIDAREEDDLDEQRIWWSDLSNQEVHLLTSGAFDFWPYWVDNDTVIFARIDESIESNTVRLANIGHPHTIEVLNNNYYISPSVDRDRRTIFVGVSPKLTPGSGFRFVEDVHIWKYTGFSDLGRR